MGFSPHVALPHNTGRDSHSVYGAIKLGVTSCHKHFIQPATSHLPESVQRTARGIPVRIFLGKIIPRRRGIPVGAILFLQEADLRSNCVDNKRQLMDKLVRSRAVTVWEVSAELINHSATNVRSNPYVGIKDPDNVAFCLSICSTQVPDLRIGTEILHMTVGSVKERIFSLDEDSCINSRKVTEQPLQDGIGWVLGRIYAVADGELVARIGLPKGRSKAFVKLRVKTLHRAEDGEVGYLVMTQRWTHGTRRRAGVVSEQAANAYYLDNSHKTAPTAEDISEKKVYCGHECMIFGCAPQQGFQMPSSRRTAGWRGGGIGMLDKTAAGEQNRMKWCKPGSRLHYHYCSWTDDSLGRHCAVLAHGTISRKLG